jgi:hypothetical protein
MGPEQEHGDSAQADGPPGGHQDVSGLQIVPVGQRRVDSPLVLVRPVGVDPEPHGLAVRAVRDAEVVGQHGDERQAPACRRVVVVVPPRRQHGRGVHHLDPQLFIAATSLPSVPLR